MQEVVTKELPAFGGLTRQTNPLEVPATILSRQTTGIRGYSLFVTPGKPQRSQSASPRLSSYTLARPDRSGTDRDVRRVQCRQPGNWACFPIGFLMP
jgi:hypothetical protein